jgi:hypothetical protein
MSVDDRGGLVTDLRDHVGDGLRVVATYDRDGYDAFYVRDDVAARIPEVADDLHSDLILQGMGRDRLEDLFAAGDLHCSMHRFDDLTAFHFIRDEFTGLFVTIDTETEVALQPFAAACERRLV